MNICVRNCLLGSLNPFSPMFQCGLCSRWFHFQCLKMTMSTGLQFCQPCLEEMKELHLQAKNKRLQILEATTSLQDHMLPKEKLTPIGVYHGGFFSSTDTRDTPPFNYEAFEQAKNKRLQILEATTSLQDHMLPMEKLTPIGLYHGEFLGSADSRETPYSSQDILSLLFKENQELRRREAMRWQQFESVSKQFLCKYKPERPADNECHVIVQRLEPALLKELQSKQGTVAAENLIPEVEVDDADDYQAPTVSTRKNAPRTTTKRPPPEPENPKRSKVTKPWFNRKGAVEIEVDDDYHPPTAAKRTIKTRQGEPETSKKQTKFINKKQQVVSTLDLGNIRVNSRLQKLKVAATKRNTVVATESLDLDDRSPKTTIRASSRLKNLKIKKLEVSKYYTRDLKRRVATIGIKPSSSKGESIEARKPDKNGASPTPISGPKKNAANQITEDHNEIQNGNLIGNSRSYECQDCHASYKRKHFLELHRHKKHKSPEVNVCTDVEANKTVFKRNVKNSNEIDRYKEYQCQDCEAEYLGSSHLRRNRRNKHASPLKRHRRNKHASPEVSVCEKNETTKTALKIRGPNKIGHHRKYKCRDCDVSYNAMQQLKRHRSNKHASPEVSVCEKNKTTETALKMKGPNKIGHHRRYKCRDCDVSYNESGHLKRHRSKNHVSPYESTNKTGKMTALEQKVKDRRSMIGRSKLYECQYCDYAYYKKTFLNQHCRTKHPFTGVSIQDNNSTDGSGSENIVSTNRVARKIFEAPAVQMSSSTTNSSNDNESGSAQFEKKKVMCNICKRTFASAAGRTNHIRSKHPQHYDRGQRFWCDICQQTFSSDVARLFHIKFRHPEREHNYSLVPYIGMPYSKAQLPFNCAVCGQRFQTHELMVNHVAQCSSWGCAEGFKVTSHEASKSGTVSLAEPNHSKEIVEVNLHEGWLKLKPLEVFEPQLDDKAEKEDENEKESQEEKECDDYFSKAPFLEQEGGCHNEEGKEYDNFSNAPVLEQEGGCHKDIGNEFRNLDSSVEPSEEWYTSEESREYESNVPDYVLDLTQKNNILPRSSVSVINFYPRAGNYS